jgi:cell division septation protein DedD
VLDTPEVVAGEIDAPAAAPAPAVAPAATAAAPATAPAPAGRSRAEEEKIAEDAIAALTAAGGGNAAAAPAVPAAPAAQGGDVRVQVGIFAERANADRAAGRLQQAGIAATIRQESTSGKTFWSVIANGPAPSATFVDKVRAAGFADAYAVSG